MLSACLLFLNCVIIELHHRARPSRTRQRANPGGNKEERHYLANQLLAAVQMYGSENVVSLERLQQ